MSWTRNLLLLVGALCCAFSNYRTVSAQGYPQRPIKIVVPFPAGGANDTVARVLAQDLSSRLGQPVIVENQAGAGGTLGARFVATANPDAYTLLMVVPTTVFGTAPVLYKLNYDPQRAFDPIGLIAADKLIMVGAPSIPTAEVRELVQYSKANPDKLNYGSAIGIVPHFLMELFKIRSGAKIVHVPYRGGAPMISDLLGGQIQMTINNKSVLLPHILAGNLKPIAVLSADRWPELRNVPTLIETGYADFPHDALFGLVAPSGTPRASIRILHSAITEALHAPAVRASFAKLGVEPKGGSSEEFAKLIADDAPRWAEIVKITGIKLD
jgi:tripartite-type tricarboxylate transporter receptor subunit TctC